VTYFTIIWFLFLLCFASLQYPTCRQLLTSLLYIEPYAVGLISGHWHISSSRAANCRPVFITTTIPSTSCSFVCPTRLLLNDVCIFISISCKNVLQLADYKCLGLFWLLVALYLIVRIIYSYCFFNSVKRTGYFMYHQFEDATV
jgi:hypothetical protein